MNLKRRYLSYIFSFLSLIWILFYSLPGFSQNIVFSYYTIDQGLSQNMVDCIMKDSRGFMWFGTWNGLNRFDGYDFVVYKNNSQDTNSICENFIYSLCEDIYGNIWIGSESALSVYIFSGNWFLNYQTGNSSIPLIHNINCLMVDKTENIWIGSDNGLEIIKPIDNQGEFERLTESYSIRVLNGNAINSMDEDEDGNVWIGTGSGLYFYNMKANQCSQIISGIGYPGDLLSNGISSVYVAKDDILWIGFEVMGAIRYNIKTRMVYFYLNNPDVSQSLIHNSVRDIQEDISGNVLIGTLGGLCTYNPVEDNFIRFSDDLDNKSTLNNVFVNSLYADDDGNIWIGTERGGVNKYNIHQKKFTSLVNEPGIVNSLDNNTVNSIFEDDKYLWIGTAGGGLNRYNKASKSFKFYKYDPHDPGSLNNDFITSITRDYLGNLWVSAWGGGLHKLTQSNEERGLFIKYVDDSPASLVNVFVSSVLEDRLGRLWIGTLGGLDVIDPGTDLFIHIIDTALSKPLTEVGCLQFDKEGNLWAGTIHGLYKIQASSDGIIYANKPKISYFKSNTQDLNSLSGNYIISICLDSRDTLWFGTYGNGLNKLINVKNGNLVCKRYAEEEGLSNNTIYGILEDHWGNLWMSTDNGLSRLNILNNTFKNYYKSDGLLSNQYYWSASYKNKEGKMYFGSMKGLNIFHPDSIRENKVPPRILLTNLKIYNRPVEVGKEYFGTKVLKEAIAVANEITLSYKSKEFTIEFSALHYDQPDKNRYKYQLKGYDPDWVEVDSKHRYASYSNLDGGDYLFMVKASNNDGLWSEEPLTIKVNIIPPFWKTWWFRITLAMLLISLTLIYIRVRLHALKIQKIKLERKVEERTAMIEEQKEELESQKDRLIELNQKVQHANQQRMQFFTNISHEFRTPLTLIMSPLEQLLEDLSVKQVIKQKLQLIHTNARRLFKLINQLMELRKIETGKIELSASQDDIILFIENIANSFRELALRRDLEFEFSYEPESIKTFFDHEKVENIVYNLLSNAFKYSNKNGAVVLEMGIVDQVKISKDEVIVVEQSAAKSKADYSYIEIKVTDNGIGIERDHLHDIFRLFYRVPSSKGFTVHGTGIGLSLVKELVKSHRGLLLVKSEPGKGSSFRVLLPKGDAYLLPEEKITNDAEEYDRGKRNDLASYTKTNENQDNRKDKISEVQSSYQPLVLIVEDNAELRGYLAGQLKTSFRIIEAANGKEGLDMAKIQSPDLIISDIMMPEVNGLELCAKIKSELPTSHIPVILLTSRAGVEDQIEGYEIGADDYIPKPFNVNLLESRIRNLIRMREKLKELFMGSIFPEAKDYTNNSSDESFLQKAIKTVSDNIAVAEFSVEGFASEMNISRSLLHKKLTAIVGVSANDFITSIRLKKAASLLKNSDANISEASYQVGFNDPKYFSRCFKKHFGKSPSDFIKEKPVF